MQRPLILASSRALRWCGFRRAPGTPGARPYLVADGATGAAAQGPGGGLTPADLATAYGLNTTGGAGQTVAIVDAYNDPKMNADLQTFDNQYGLAPCSTSNGCLKIVNQSGGSALPRQ